MGLRTGTLTFGTAALALALLATRAAEALYVYPAKGQSQARMQRDKLQCSHWATRKTGFDPPGCRRSTPRVSRHAAAPCGVQPGARLAGRSVVPSPEMQAAGPQSERQSADCWARLGGAGTCAKRSTPDARPRLATARTGSNTAALIQLA